jgi:hypothetical protein
MTVVIEATVKLPPSSLTCDDGGRFIVVPTTTVIPAQAGIQCLSLCIADFKNKKPLKHRPTNRKITVVLRPLPFSLQPLFDFPHQRRRRPLACHDRDIPLLKIIPLHRRQFGANHNIRVS